MAQPRPTSYLQRLLGAALPAPTAIEAAAPQPDPADFGTAYGLDLSFAQQAFASPLPPAEPDTPQRR